MRRMHILWLKGQLVANGVSVLHFLGPTAMVVPLNQTSGPVKTSSMCACMLVVHQKWAMSTRESQLTRHQIPPVVDIPCIKNEK